MWETLVIWLAEALIKHFLNTQITLRQRLADAMQRNAAYQQSLDSLNTQQEKLQKEIDQRTADVNARSIELDQIHQKILDLEKEKNDKLEEIKTRVDNMSDSAVIRTSL